MIRYIHRIMVTQWCIIHYQVTLINSNKIPQCQIHCGMLIPQCILYHGDDFIVEYLCDYLAKIEIVPEYLQWAQEKLFDKESNIKRSRDTVPLT